MKWGGRAKGRSRLGVLGFGFHFMYTELPTCAKSDLTDLLQCDCLNMGVYAVASIQINLFYVAVNFEVRIWSQTNQCGFCGKVALGLAFLQFVF